MGTDWDCKKGGGSTFNIKGTSWLGDYALDITEF